MQLSPVLTSTYRSYCVRVLDLCVDQVPVCNSNRPAYSDDTSQIDDDEGLHPSSDIGDPFRYATLDIGILKEHYDRAVPS